MRKRITQRVINMIVLILVMIIVGVLIYSNRSLRKAIQSDQDAARRKSVCEQLGKNVEDASDYLTEEVRKYIATGEEIHFDNYWNEVRRVSRREEAITRLKQMNLGNDITLLLELAKTVSDELIQTEAEAMYLEKCFLGHSSDEELLSYLTGEECNKIQRLSKEEQRLQAISLLFDENYSKKKEVIYNYISDFNMLMTQRLDRDVRLAREATEEAILIGNISWVATVVLVLFIIILIYGAFIRPVLYYERCIQLSREDTMKPRGTAEIYHLGTAIYAMYDRMRGAIQAKSEFLAVMSHEIRTPLHSMLGYHFLLSKTDLSEQQQKYVEYLQESTENLMGIVNNILDYSKLNNLKFQIEESDFSVFLLAEELEKSFVPLCREKGLYFKVSVDSDHYEYFLADYTKIRQILNNLIGNAVKFTNTGGIKVFLKIWEREEQVILAVQVQDSGIGIRKEDQEKIFFSFEQADATITRRYGGTGLGLPICKQMAELLGGDIKVTSTEGMGSLFVVNIPVKIQEEQKHSGRQDIQIEWQFPDLCALLVDDNEINGKMQKEILELFQIRTDIAFSGAEAEEYTKCNQYDFILMDIRMPDMDGYETTHLIRRNPDYKRIPVIALTADVQENVRKKAQEADMCEVLAKPILISALQKILLKYFSYYAKRAEVVELMPDDTVCILEDNKKLYSNLVTMFVKNHEQDFLDLRRQIRCKNRKVILDILHMLKGVTGTIGAYPLQQSILDIEKAIMQKRITWGQLQEQGEIIYERFLSIKKTMESQEGDRGDSRRAPDHPEHTAEEIQQWNELYEEFAVHIEENDFEAVELFQSNRSVFVDFLGADRADRLEQALQQFDYEEAEEYL